MTHFTESTLEETALEWLKDMGCQRIAFGKTDTRTATNAVRCKCKRMKSHKGTMTDSCALVSLRGGMLLEMTIKGQPVLAGGRWPRDAISRGVCHDYISS